ncbi:type VII toxin-antitoxin system HepT family RNase toxin [Nitrospira calida]|jgi:uncharacterized protein YutE (UPF0331/DUF86 family)
MLDRERILAKLDELEGYLGELRQIVPASFAEYMDKLEKRRACERLLQLAIQCMMDVCALFVAGLRLGLPAEENDIFEKLERARIIAPPLTGVLKTMKGFRNILVHEYGGLDNAIVYKMASTRLEDLEAFKARMVQALQEKDR